MSPHMHSLDCGTIVMYPEHLRPSSILAILVLGALRASFCTLSSLLDITSYSMDISVYFSIALTKL